MFGLTITSVIAVKVPMIMPATIPPVLHFFQYSVRSTVGRFADAATAMSTSEPLDVPTFDESGLKGFNIGTWFGVLAPAATPKDVLARLNAEMVKVIQSPDFRKRMAEIGAEPIGNTPEQMARQIREETEKFAKLVKDAKVVIE